MKTDTPFVSVVIPVYNDTERLLSCLGALEKQTYPGACFEVVVVENGPCKDGAEATKQFKRVKIAHEPVRGCAMARNRGISESKGDILAFTDADCIPVPGWIEEGVAQLLATPNCGVVGGRIEFVFRDQLNPTIPELYDSFVHLQQRSNVEFRRFAVTANLFTTREVIDKVGFFDSDTFRLNGEDIDFCRRVLLAGFTLSYAERACVRHPARTAFRFLYAKLVRVVDGHFSADRKNKLHSLSAKVSEGTGKPFIWRRIHKVLGDKNLGWRRAALIAVGGVFLFIGAFERLRLELGAKPRR